MSDPQTQPNPEADAPAPTQAQAAPKKKKERIIVKPKTPSSVSTAFLILRGALAGVIGAPIGGPDSLSSLMQPSFIKDKYPSGKFSVNLGKKQGTACELDIPSAESEQEKEKQSALLLAIQEAANRIIAENVSITSFTMDRQEAIDAYGTGILDQSQLKLPKKAKPEHHILTIAHMNGVIMAVPPGPVLQSTKGVGKITLETNLCHITAGKKSRKCDIVLKFRVDGADETMADAQVTDAATAAVSPDQIQSLLQSIIRMPEGEKIREEEAIEAAKALAIAKEEAEAMQVEEEAAQPAASQTPDEEMVVNAFEVKGKIDYSKLVNDFGSKLIDPELLARIERLTVGRGTVPKLHRFLRRDIFFSHRDMVKICECLETNQPFYLYTGRGPSSGAMHLGHLVPFMFTQWLQQAFQCPLVIQMTDDEKFLFKGVYDPDEGDNLDYFAQLTVENAKDIIACGFIPEKTFLFSDLKYVGRMYPTIVRIWKAVTTNTVTGIFGFDGTSNIGKVAFPAIQAAPSFPSAFPTVLGTTKECQNMACLIPCAIDQDPYFRMTRDIAHKLVPKTHPLGGKPALIHSKFFPPLQGADGKMSSSDNSSAIFLTDSEEEIERKIKAYAFSGGQETKKLQEEFGANLAVDVSYQWLRFFLEDDEELEKIGKDYSTGSGEFWSTGKVKARLVEVLKDIVKTHQARRDLVTEDVVNEWMLERSIL